MGGAAAWRLAFVQLSVQLRARVFGFLLRLSMAARAPLFAANNIFLSPKTFSPLQTTHSGKLHLCSADVCVEDRRNLHHCSTFYARCRAARAACYFPSARMVARSWQQPHSYLLSLQTAPFVAWQAGRWWDTEKPPTSFVSCAMPFSSCLAARWLEKACAWVTSCVLTPRIGQGQGWACKHPLLYFLLGGVLPEKAL